MPEKFFRYLKNLVEHLKLELRSFSILLRDLLRVDLKIFGEVGRVVGYVVEIRKSVDDEISEVGALANRVVLDCQMFEVGESFEF